MSENPGLSRITVKFDLWYLWLLVTFGSVFSDVTFDLSEKKNYRNTFGRPSPRLSNAVCRFSLRRLVFEISGGGGHPPVGAKLSQTPVGARVER